MANSLDLFIFLLASQLGEHLYEFVHVYIPEKYIPEKFYINVLFNSMNIYKFMIMVSQNICISITWNNIIVNTNKTIF